MARRRRSGLGASNAHHRIQSEASLRNAKKSYARALKELTRSGGSCEVAFDEISMGSAAEGAARADYDAIDRGERTDEYLPIAAADKELFSRPFDLFRKQCMRKSTLRGLAGMRRRRSR